MRKFLALLLSCWPMWAVANIGSVIELAGLVIIKRGSEVVTVTKSTPIQMNDRVESKNGRVKIEFQDRTTVAVTEHSTLVIDDFVYDPAKSSGKLSIRAAEGTVRYVSGAIAKNNPKNVNIKTPTATVAVRGTDFVMSVNEIGSSMIILMPSCDNTGCITGIIDVATPFGTVTLDKPYHATLVEPIAAPPAPPITVNLANTPVNNNLHISPPAASSGVSVIAAAREAAAKTGDASASTTAGSESQVKQTAALEAKPTTEPVATTSVNPATDISKVILVSESVSPPVEKTNTETVAQTETAANSNVKPIYSNSSQINQVGWLYERLTGSNYVNIRLPNDTKVNVVSNQNRQSESVVFNPVPSQGTIIVNQVYR